MSTGLENYPNIEAADSDYPNGNIKDKDISLPGTPVNKLVYADMHQTLAKLLREVNITANGLPDNEYNGFQYIEAMKYLLGNHRRIKTLTGSGVGVTAESDYNTLVIVKPDAGALDFVTLVEPTGSYIGRCVVANYSLNSVEIFNILGDNIDGSAPPFILPAGDYAEFLYDSGGTLWTVPVYYKLDI